MLFPQDLEVDPNKQDVGWVSEALPIASFEPVIDRWVTLRSPIASFQTATSQWVTLGSPILYVSFWEASFRR